MAKGSDATVVRKDDVIVISRSNKEEEEEWKKKVDSTFVTSSLQISNEPWLAALSKVKPYNKVSTRIL